jgi:hypothetical protein
MAYQAATAKLIGQPFLLRILLLLSQKNRNQTAPVFHFYVSPVLGFTFFYRFDKFGQYFHGGHGFAIRARNIATTV